METGPLNLLVGNNRRYILARTYTDLNNYFSKEIIGGNIIPTEVLVKSVLLLKKRTKLCFSSTGS